MKHFKIFTLLCLLLLSFAIAIKPGETIKLPTALQDSFGKRIEIQTNHWLVFYFYPRAGTPGCSTQNVEYTRLYPKFLEAKVQVFGVSSDSAAAQCEFIKNYKLQVPQVPDTLGEVAKLFDVGGFLGFYSRDTIVVSPKGTVAQIRREVNPTGDASEALKFILAQK